ncbi:MAG: 6,7-dimethyl-8-ribityllumazine synthase [Candidatus Omnitrophica bacterium]|nr:6,7-dimethyl-8-ribityllumazine synthase [Candidatus Omnitrophota bacterium]
MKKDLKKRSFLAKARFGVVVAQFNSFITEQLLKACLDEFSRLGVCDCEVQVVFVPGAFELPLAALKLGQKKNIQAVICLGAVIRGQTLHYELVAGQAARGIMDVSLRSGKPVIFEVLAADTIKLCEARSKPGDRDNKGACAARAAFDLVETLKGI